MLQNFEQLAERLVVAAFGCRVQGFFDAVIAGNDCRIHPTHARCTLSLALRIACEALAPITNPIVNAWGLGKLLTQPGLGVRALGSQSKAAERQCEICLGLLHGRQKSVDQIGIPFAPLSEADLAAQLVEQVRLELSEERFENCCRQTHCLVGIGVDQRQ
jgi:hypothetical protein